MKWFAFFMSFYIIVIGNIPCNTDDRCCVEEVVLLKKGQNTDIQKLPLEEKRTEKEMPCSPLFPCFSHISFVVVYPGVPAIYWEICHKADYKLLYKSTLTKSNPSAVWRPPATA
ncbi:MAG: hypothetical protein QM610_00030 [Chitinophagaceae bacterium]